MRYFKEQVINYRSLKNYRSWTAKRMLHLHAVWNMSRTSIKETFSAPWPFVREIHLSLVVCPQNGRWHGALMFSLICFWTNGWARCSCSRCNKNTQHIESRYLLQPPKHSLLFVNRFRHINNNITKDRCPIPIDTTVRLGPLKFSPQATIDHHGPSIDSGHYTASINCCKKTLYCNDHTITEFGITDKNSSTAYIVLYKWIDTWFLDSNRRVGVWSLPWRWHILSIPLTTGRGTSAEACGLDDVFPPDDLGSRPEALCYIYIYMYIYNVCTFLIRVLL